MSFTGHGTPAMYRAELRLGGSTCEACRAAHNTANRRSAAANPRRRPSTGRPVGRPVGSHSRRDEAMAKWDRARDTVSFKDFAWQIGVSLLAWERMFQRARRAGDVRAWRTQSLSLGRRAA